MAETDQLVLGGVLEAPAARRALAKRDLSVVYQLLNDAGLSQVSIGRLTGQKQSEIADILAGRRVHSYDLLCRIADGLGVPRGRLGLGYDPAVLPADGEAVESPDDDQDDDVQRRNLLRHGAAVLLGAPVFGPVDPITAAEAATPMIRPVVDADVRRIAAVTARLRSLDDVSGGAAMTETLTAHISSVEALLAADMSETLRSGVLSALADAHDAAGWAAGDAGSRDLARQHFMRGMSCAGAAGDATWASVNFYGAGRMELEYGGAVDALKIFQLGAGAARTNLGRALFESGVTRAFGALHEESQATAAMRRARDAEAAAGADEPTPFAYYAKATRYAFGQAHADLGRYGAAVQQLELDATTLGIQSSRCHTLNAGDLAAAQIRSGELRLGLASAVRALDGARGLRSPRTLRRLGRLHAAASARPNAACRDLAQAITELRAAA